MEQPTGRHGHWPGHPQLSALFPDPPGLQSVQTHLQFSVWIRPGRVRRPTPHRYIPTHRNRGCFISCWSSGSSYWAAPSSECSTLSSRKRCTSRSTPSSGRFWSFTPPDSSSVCSTTFLSRPNRPSQAICQWVNQGINNIALIFLIVVVSPIGSMYQRNVLKDQMDTVVKFHRQSLLNSRTLSNASNKTMDPLMVV